MLTRRGNDMNIIIYGAWIVSQCMLRIWCFIVGHDIAFDLGFYIDGDPERCRRCHITWPSERTTVPVLLGRAYRFMVDRNWRWFEALDIWLTEHIRMPSWWAY